MYSCTPHTQKKYILRFVSCLFDQRILLITREQLNDEQLLQMDMACAGAQALHSLSESKTNKEAMRKCGLVPLMARMLKGVHIDLITSIMGICHHCASEVIISSSNRSEIRNRLNIDSFVD